MSRQLIVVDVETDRLSKTSALSLEVAAINMTTGEELVFVPFGATELARQADPGALAVNRFFERRLPEEELGPLTTKKAFASLEEWLKGNTLAGCNPSFDAAVLDRELAKDAYAVSEAWHHRLADLSALTAGALGMVPTGLPGLSECCRLLGVPHMDSHSALGDARATADCFRELERRAERRLA
ncbi:exonuclease domain-containing protein [Prescottella equi]|uniref:3'-5' exonuclease n=1 Tax=Rhodococcus hoagii TaxID=43767 RepID=UPI000A104FA1|nr:exonuclease domain-containing protein [Prescottella equi]ORL35002.1 hypothetical protein A6I91_02000 [Prescottella equi]